MEAQIFKFQPSHLSVAITDDLPRTHTKMVDFILVQIAKPHKSESSKAHFKQIISKLKGFTNKHDREIYTYDITVDFLHEFEYFLKGQNLRPNTIQGIVVSLQGLCKKAGTYGFKVSGDYDEFHSSGEKTNEIALSMNDVTRIYYFDKLTKKQKEIRDLFIVGCMTGLRYSDYSRLSLDYMHEGIITIRTKKTGTVVYIPVHPYVQEIIARNGGKIPAVGKSISYFNKYIKLICEKVGMTEIIPKIRVVGFNSVKEEKRKCDMIGSHTARRSFATIMYNSGKFTAAQIMLITGHSSEKSFFRYIRINPEDNARAIAATMKSLM